MIKSKTQNPPHETYWALFSFTFQSLQGVISTQNKKNQSAGYNGAGMVYAYFCKFLQIFPGEFCKNSTFFTNSLENLVCQSTFSEEVTSTPLPPSKKEGEPVRTSPPLKVSKSRKQFLVFSIMGITLIPMFSIHISKNRTKNKKKITRELPGNSFVRFL